VLGESPCIAARVQEVPGDHIIIIILHVRYVIKYNSAEDRHYNITITRASVTDNIIIYTYAAEHLKRYTYPLNYPSHVIVYR